MIFVIGALVVLFVMNFILFAKNVHLKNQLMVLTDGTHAAIKTVNERIDVALLTPEDRTLLGFEKPALTFTEPEPVKRKNEPKKKPVDTRKVCKNHNYSGEYVGKINLSANKQFAFSENNGVLKTCYQCQDTLVRGRRIGNTTSYKWHMDGFR